MPSTRAPPCGGGAGTSGGLVTSRGGPITCSAGSGPQVAERVAPPLPSLSTDGPGPQPWAPSMPPTTAMRTLRPLSPINPPLSPHRPSLQLCFSHPTVARTPTRFFALFDAAAGFALPAGGLTVVRLLLGAAAAAGIAALAFCGGFPPTNRFKYFPVTDTGLSAISSGVP